MDAKNQHRSFLLALPHQEERHLGVNIAANITKILTEFGISERQVGYFIADNADNNNTYINDLFIEFGFNPLYYCLYYIGYIINLVTYILLFGVNLSALDKEEEDPDTVLR